MSSSKGMVSLEFVPSIAEWRSDQVESAVTVGMFDGLHLGHQALVGQLTTGAIERGLRSVVVTFDRHPKEILAGSRGPGVITILREKQELLDQAHVGMCALIPGHCNILHLDAEEFVREYLVTRLRARLVVVGYDFRFGRGRTGDFALLQVLGRTYGYTVTQATPVFVGERPVKSTWIRNCIQAGEMADAARLLGRPYTLSGPVQTGAQIGRQLGFPTANVGYSPEKLLPALGVYGGYAVAEGRRQLCAINIGVRPTIDSDGGEAATLVEAHLIGFDGDLYGKNVTLELFSNLRKEQRFSSLEALRTQIWRDVEEIQRQAPTWGTPQR